ncbi:hypothetical protein ACFWBV_34835 [Streptomyces sp. NPDC060030]|uniref:hypothetical protein n=1 Tax=Streptomyces sp. NPDC060030 TaxID=3347042 RepID=UPI00367CEC2E
MTTSDPDWWNNRPSDRDRPSDAQWWSEPPSDRGDAAELADAADQMRAAADALRDAATPAAPPKEKSFDFSYIWNWLRHTSNGRAAKHAAYSFAPLWTVFLTTQQFPFTTATGITFIAFVFVGVWHLRIQRQFTRFILWGACLGLAYYAPVAIVFGLAGILVGG